MAHRTDSPDRNTTEPAPGTYYVHPDGYGEPTLWRATDHYPVQVAWRCDLDRLDPALWPLVTGVLTQDAEMVERVARALAATVMPDWWDQISEDHRHHYRTQARAALSGLLPGTEAGA